MVKLLLFFFNWDNFYSKIITKVTKCDYSHIGIGYFDEKVNAYVIYESINKGFVKSNYNANLNVSKYCKIVEVKECDKETIEKIADKYLGIGYDWLTVINIGLIYIFGKSIIKYNNGTKKLICSEAVSRVLNDLKIVDLSLILGKDFDYITPQDIYTFFCECRKEYKEVKV